MVPGTECLKNKFALTDPSELAAREAEYAALRESQLRRIAPRHTFGRAYLSFLHGWLFQDIYHWAGEFRSVPINKGGSEFAQPRFLEAEARRIFTELANEGRLRRVAEANLPDRLAYYFGELNALHPFREGNGRVQRLFLLQVLELRGLSLSWSEVTPNEIVGVSIAAHQGNAEPAQLMFRRIIQRI